ncbi:MAG: M48 family metallopeptidase [bacterium]
MEIRDPENTIASTEVSEPVSAEVQDSLEKAQVTDQDSTAKAKKYNRIKLTLSLIEMALSFTILVALLLAGWSKDFDQIAHRFSASPYIALFIFGALVGLVETVLLFPLGFYSSYILEHKFGLSNQTIWRWLWEEFKGFAVGLVLLTPMVLIFYFFLRNFGDLWWLPVAATVFFFSVLLARIAPILIFPLFYRFEPLPDSDLKTKILELCQKVGMRVEGVFKFNMSKNTKKANAGFTGLGKTKRIILGDTLLDKFNDDEIETVFAHELGHYAKGHIWKGILIGLVSNFAGLYITSVLYKISLPVFGFESIEQLGALPLLALFLTLFGLVTMPIQNAISRRYERQADTYAVQLTGKREAFVLALKKLSEQNLADPDPNPVVESLFYSHPAIKKRVALVKSIA